VGLKLCEGGFERTAFAAVAATGVARDDMPLMWRYHKQTILSRGTLLSFGFRRIIRGRDANERETAATPRYKPKDLPLGSGVQVVQERPILTRAVFLLLINAAKQRIHRNNSFF
jgi:hypothetical protein